MRFGYRLFRTAIVSSLAIGLFVPLAGSAVADHDDEDDDNHEFGAWIYEGTCSTLGTSPVFEIGDLETQDDMARELHLTPPVPDRIYGEDEGIDATYASLASSPHSIVVRATERTSSAVIACGEITNIPATETGFAVPLATIDSSGYTGAAWIEPSNDDEDDDDEYRDEIQVTVGIWEGVSTPTSATPSA